jgi:hypothetical protein
MVVCMSQLLLSKNENLFWSISKLGYFWLFLIDSCMCQMVWSRSKEPFWMSKNEIFLGLFTVFQPFFRALVVYRYLGTIGVHKKGIFEEFWVFFGFFIFFFLFFFNYFCMCQMAWSRSKKKPFCGV